MDRRSSAGGGEVTPPTDDDARPIGFWLKLVDGLIDRRFAEVLDEHGVTRRQWQLLDLLERGPATRSTLDEAVAPFLDVGAGETSADDLTELVDSGWVALTTDGVGDGRHALTERGSVAHRRLVAVVDDARDEVMRGAEPEAYATTVRFLRDTAHALGWRP